jgi:tetratricopeptide (TPR) repeat protein
MGDLPAARQWLEAHDCWLDWGGAALGRSEGHLLWARYERAAGSASRARDRAMQALAHAIEPRQPLALIAAHRLLGELDTDAGRDQDALAHLDTALLLAETCAAPFERALTLAALAELHATTGKRTEARRLLDEAREIGLSLGAKPLIGRIDALAVNLATALPIAPARRSSTGTYPGGLTAREVEVLRLIAAGWRIGRSLKCSRSARGRSAITCCTSSTKRTRRIALPPPPSPFATASSDSIPPTE